MAGGVNKVILVGNLGADPETRTVSGGSMKVVRITVATHLRWKDKTSGEMKENTEWHRISFFNRLGEIAAQYLRKGSKVYIEGSLRTSKYTDKNGVEKYSTEIVANEMQMLDARGANNADASGSHGTTAAMAVSSQTQANDFDDDIPF